MSDEPQSTNQDTGLNETTETTAATGSADNAGATQAAPKPDAKPDAKPSTKKVKARVLVTGQYGEINDLVDLHAEVAKLAEKAGQVDTSKAAVEYAASLDQNQK